MMAESLRQVTGLVDPPVAGDPLNDAEILSIVRD